ncbi:MAG: hypothetical protein P1Q69_02055, partial [Candidatus Thorarchaeota archaeon]|nr:hypothetical protein [Candidatus Thorarchaeota archaeon]
MGIVGKFFDCFNYPVLGWYRDNHLRYLGDTKDLENILEEFESDYETEFSLSESEEISLPIDNPELVGTLSNLLNKRFADISSRRNFISDFRSRTIICTTMIKEKDEPLVIHDKSFFEAMKYRLLVLPQGVTLQIDPVIRVFVRKDEMYVDEPLIAHCEGTDCSEYEDCTKRLPRSVIHYVKDEPEIEGICPEVDLCSEIYNPWTAQFEHVPKLALMGKPEGSDYRVKARIYALKKANARWKQTKYLFDKLRDDEGIRLNIGKGDVLFETPFLELDIADSSTYPYKYYAKAGEIPLTFGDGLSHVDPYTGLK